MAMDEFRIEKDSLGEVKVPKEALYGAQTARSLQHFSIGHDRIPHELIKQYALLKKGCALANAELGKLSEDKKRWILEACDSLIAGEHAEAFPLRVYQTGSGTQTNMNVNEVIANLANLQAGSSLGAKKPVHPNDHVNMSQSTNDTFPTVMHMSCIHVTENKLMPSLKKLHQVLVQKQNAYKEIIKIGRTHLMDAVPLSLGQEFSGYAAQIEQNIHRIEASLVPLTHLPIGGSAVGTGLNTHKDFAKITIRHLSELAGKNYVPSQNKFAQIAAHDALVFVSGAFKTLACSLIKIATDLAWMGSGPRCGLGELYLPENEPGSSIMPGKVNPTQCEALSMVSAQVIGYDTAITFAGTQGNFELNVYKPLIIFNLIQSANLLADALDHFIQYLLIPIEPNLGKIDYFVKNSLMLVTALSPKIGYDKAAEVAHYAYKHNTSLKEAAIKLQFLSAEEFDKLLNVKEMIHP